MSEPIHIISLGAGVQSSCMALMASRGEIQPMPNCAIFADTQWERKRTYAWLDWLKPRLHFPTHIVTKSNIRSDNINARLRGKAENGERGASLPYFTLADGSQIVGRVKRQCTADYKIEPIEKFIRREILGLKPGERAPNEVAIVQWRGISTDESSRMKDSRVPWMQVRYPLAMEFRMSRADCSAWVLNNYGVLPPRSACIGCPFHSDAEWRNIRDNDPEEWADAIEFDRSIRRAGGMRGECFLHRSCKPLDEVDLSTEEDRGQTSMFNNECEGMCNT